jgi:glycosyltransferase involved in cell wall biosynthesis
MSLVDIVIPSYNRPDYLERLLNSINVQTFKDFQIIVIDDSSIDEKGYSQVINKFSNELNLKYIRNKTNNGVQYSRNKGILETKSKYVAFVDDDDVWLPNKLLKQVDRFETSPDIVGLLYSWADTLDQTGNIIYKYRAIHRGQCLSDLLNNNFIPAPSVIVRRSVLGKIGAFDENLPSCQDWDMWTRIVESGFSIDLVEDVLVLYQKHDRQSIGKSSASFNGYYLYYEKHKQNYIKLGMKYNLSEKYRSLAYNYYDKSELKYAYRSIVNSIGLCYHNWKSWLRLSQFIFRLK